MEYNKENYEGRRIWLFPNDTYTKKGIIKNVDDLGFTILITEADKESDYRVGAHIFSIMLAILNSSFWISGGKRK